MTPLVAILLAQIAGLPGQIQTPNAGRWVSTQGTYQCTATGCVSRSMASKLGDTFSVKDIKGADGLGCVGDGVHDDTSCIQAAHDALPSGGTIIFPAGTYKTTAQINISNPNITFSFGGWATIIKPSSATFDVFFINQAGQSATFLNGQIQGAATDNTTTQWGIRMNDSPGGSNRGIINGMLFSGADSTHGLNNGVKLYSAQEWRVTNNTFERLQGVISGTGYGVLEAGAGDCLHNIVSNNNFIGAAGQGRHAVYLSTGCERCIVASNEVFNFNDVNIVIYATSVQSGNRYNLINDNVTYNGLIGVQVAGFSEYNVVEGNILRSPTQYGVEVISFTGQATGNLVRNNYVHWPARHGIYIEGAATTIVDNIAVFNAGGGAGQTYDAVNVVQYNGTAATNTRISNIRNWGTFARAGIYVDSAAPAPTGTIIKDVEVYDYGGAFYPIMLNGVAVTMTGAYPASVGNSFNRGDADVSLFSFIDYPVQPFQTTLTANRTVTLPSSHNYTGQRFRIVRTGLGAFTLNVGGLKTIPSGTAAFVDVEYNGVAWSLTGYGTL